MNLLLVEDDEADAALLERHLAPMIDGVVERARSLRAAVDAAAITSFDAVVLDLGLPDAWGLDTVLRFGRLVPGLPVVVLTGTQERDFAEKAERAGAVGFIRKAEDMASVATQLVAVVEGHARARSRQPGGRVARARAARPVRRARGHRPPLRHR